MEPIFSVLLYILTAAGLLMTFSFWLSDIRLGGKRFRWYYYCPTAVLCAALGTLFPTVLSGWLYLMMDRPVLAFLLIGGYLLLLIGLLAGVFLWLRRREDFSTPFYFSLSLCALFVLSGWLIRWIG